MSFADKVVLVTGASSGIGADAARHLAKLGAKVAITGRNEQRLNQVAEQIKASGSPTPLTIVADVTKDSERIIDETIQHFGKLNVLVNSAGIGSKQSFLEANTDAYDRIFETNTRSIVILTKLAVPHLEKTKGNIVNISSVAGLVPMPHLTFYSMSKAALDQFTQCISTELGPKRIRVNFINPGAIRTSIFEAAGLNAEETQNIFDKYTRLYPVGRIGEVSDTSAAIAFLASDDASFITGINLRVDGGSISSGAYSRTYMRDA